MALIDRDHLHTVGNGDPRDKPPTPPSVVEHDATSDPDKPPDQWTEGTPLRNRPNTKPIHGVRVDRSPAWVHETANM
jgi:hypothetical protein